jgi:hypothetical protein
MDENVHGAITNGLRQRNINVLTVQEDERSGISGVFKILWDRHPACPRQAGETPALQGLQKN